MITVIDFDGTVFKRNHGLIEPVVEYLGNRVVYVLTYRAPNQLQFILDTLRPTGMTVLGVAFADSRAKEAYKKVELMREILSKYDVEEVIDDDAEVRVAMEAMGLKAVAPHSIGKQWGGSFVKRKSVGTIRYIPLEEMTQDDWSWLDFDNTRTVAQARIAAEIIAGRLEGFFQVNLINKAAKDIYLWPANAAALQDFENDDWNAFGNVSDLEENTRSLDRLNVLRGLLAFLSPAALGLIVERVRDGLDDEQAQRVSKIDLDSLHSDAVELVTSTILMWKYEYDEAVALLEDMPESDETDEIRDYLGA